MHKSDRKRDKNIFTFEPQSASAILETERGRKCKNVQARHSMCAPKHSILHVNLMHRSSIVCIFYA